MGKGLRIYALYIWTILLCLHLLDANNDTVTAKAASKMILEAVVFKQDSFDWQSSSGINTKFRFIFFRGVGIFASAVCQDYLKYI